MTPRPFPDATWLHTAVRVLAAVTIACAAIANELWLGSDAARNGIQWAALGYALLLAAPSAARGPVMLLTRRRVAGIPLVQGVLAVFAFAVAAQTFKIPYLSDDHALVERARNARTVLDWLAPGQPAAGYFFRPAVWWQWWACERITPNSPAAARCASLAWFVAGALLVAPALRRCGVRRDLAILTAFLTTANPTGVTTIGWISNLYNQTSLTLALGAIASMPARRPSLRSSLVTGVLAFFAYLSKEDTMLLPVLAFAAGAGFRARNARLGIWHVLPFAVALLTSIALRYACLGSFGGYQRDSATDVTSVSRWWGGVSWGLTHEFPWRYWIPVRDTVQATWPAAAGVVLASAPVVMLLTASRVARIRRIAACAGLFIVLPLAPVGAFLGLTPSLISVRFAFTPSIGFMLLWAAGILGVSRRPGIAGALVVASLAAFTWIGHRNLESYRRAGAASERCIDFAARASAEAPEGTIINVGPLPEDTDGVYSIAAGFTFAAARRSGRSNVQPGIGVGAFADYLDFDRASQSFERPSDVKPDVVLKYGEPRTLRFSPRYAPKSVNGNVFALNDSDWCAFSPSDSTIVYFPLVGLEGPGTLRFSLDGERFEPALIQPNVSIAMFFFDGRAVFRAPFEGGAIQAPETARAVRVEVYVPLGHSLGFRGLRVELERAR